MYISRTYARTFWTLGLLATAAVLGVAFHSDVTQRWLLQCIGIVAAIWAIGWQQPRLLQLIVRAIRFISLLLAGIARQYLASMLFLVIVAASVGQQRRLSASSQSSQWLIRDSDVLVREATTQSELNLLLRSVAPHGLLFAAILAVFGWFLRLLPTAPSSGRISYGNYTLQ